MENEELPQYMRIAVSVAGRIADGQLAEGEKLSGRSKLSSEYQVSPETIRKSVQLLRDMQVVTVKEQSGVYVRSAENAKRYLQMVGEKNELRQKKQRLRALLAQQESVDGISIDRVTIEEGAGPDGKPFRYIRVAYTFENVTDSDAVAPYTDINAYQDGIKLDRSYKVQDQRAQKQIEPGGKLKSFTAFAPDSETVPVTVKVMAPGEKEPRSERCYCIVNPGLQ